MYQPSQAQYTNTTTATNTTSAPHRHPTTPLIVIHDMSLIRVERQGLTNMHDLAGRVFLAVAQTQAHVLLISQSSAEGNFCFVVPRESLDRVREAIHCELQPEIERRHVAAIRVVEDVAIVSTLPDAARLAASLCDCLAQSGISCLVYVQGAKSGSAVISAGDVNRVIGYGNQANAAGRQNPVNH
jgi:aspartokinase